MAYTELTVNQITTAGVNGALAAANSGGSFFKNTGRECVRLTNTSGGDLTMTVVTPAKAAGQGVADLACVVPATTGDKIFGPFDPEVYNRAGGWVDLSFSGVTNLSIAVFQLPDVV